MRRKKQDQLTLICVKIANKKTRKERRLISLQSHTPLFFLVSSRQQHVDLEIPWAKRMAYRYPLSFDRTDRFLALPPYGVS